MFYNRRYVFRNIALVFILISVFFSACANNEQEENKVNTEERISETNTVEFDSVETEPVETTVLLDNSVQIQTKYLTVLYSDIYDDYLLHQEVSSEDVTMEIFSMSEDNTVRELFRIYFGDETMGIVSGYLTVDNIEVPVTYTICQYNDEDFADEEARKLYLETMNCFDDIMNSIQADDRFCTEKAVAPVNSKDATLTYWTFTLPETMEYEEENNGRYEIRFYGNVAGEKIALYTIFIGEPCGNTVLGTYALNGNKLILSVESYSLVPQENWRDEDTMSAYMMMGTINDVLQIITSSENFSEETPE